MTLFATDGLLALQLSRMETLESVLRLETARYVVRSALPVLWLTFSLCYSRGNCERFLRGWKPVLIASWFLPLLPLLASGQLFIVDADIWQPGMPLELRWLARALHLLLLVSSVVVLMNLERTFSAAVGTLRWRIKFVIMG